MAKLKDIAERLQVNVSTVSRALNDHESISEEMRDKVHVVAEELGYNLHGRGGKLAPDWNVAGIIVPEVTSDYYAQIVHLTKERLAQRGYSSVIQITEFDKGDMLCALQAMKRIKVKCLLIVMDAEEAISKQFMDAVHRSQIPVMLVTSGHLTMIDVDCIHLDENIGILLGLQHLIERGYRKIGYIGERMTENRRRIFEQTMQDLGCECLPRFVCVGKERGEQGGYLRMKELLGQVDRPDAVFASYDSMAVGAIHAIREAGLAIPREVAVLGFDNITVSQYVEGGITTIANPYEDMVSIAVNILTKRVQNTGRAQQQIALRPRLIIRQST